MKGQRLRVLHVLASLGYGGAETWLMNILRKLDRDRISMDFVTTQAEAGAYAAEAEGLGSRVVTCPLRHRAWSFGRRLEAIIRHGAYDIVHSHVYLFSGYTLKVAARAGVPVRIAHIYPTMDIQRQSLRRRIYRLLMTRWINRYGNCFITDSKGALQSFWGEKGRDGGACQVIYCGIDLARFMVDVPQDEIRRKLNLPMDRPMVFNVSRFVPHKNHLGLVEIARLVLREIPDALFVLAGNGPTLQAVRERVSEKRLDNSFRFLQGMSDLTPLWKAADVFLFPTLMEGFGIVVIEAAASGLAVVAADIPGVREAAPACKACTLIRPQDIGSFAAATVGYLRNRRRYAPNPASLAPFSIENSLASLVRVYSECARSFWSEPVN